MQSRTSYLVYRWLIGTITDDEKKELILIKNEDKVIARFLEQLSDLSGLHKEYEMHCIINPARAYREMQTQVDKIRRHKAMKRFSGIAAMIVFTLACAGIWMYFPARRLDTPHLASTSGQISIDDIKPGHPAAKISFPDGKTHELSSDDSGISTSLFADAIPSPNISKTVQTPEDISLDVPRGGEFKIILEDSTVVWLNAESQLIYPATFDINERRVHVKGEVYFEVKKDESRPFYVEIAGQEIRVYGTKFNVKAYPDEECSYTTLESGVISLRKTDEDGLLSGGELYLSPGHQAVLKYSSKTVDMKIVNPEVISAWRKGRFIFEEQPLFSIMRDLSRWYDFEYEFEDPTLEKVIFMGSIPRYGDFRTALYTLESVGDATFSISGNKIIISRKKQP